MSSSFPIIVILSVFTVLNMMFIGFTWHSKVGRYACSVDNIVEGIARYIRNDRKETLEQNLAEPCQKYGISSDKAENLLNSIRQLVGRCTTESLNRRHDIIRNPLITLFTTWPQTNDSTKQVMHNMTLRNWANFKPKVELAVFTNDSSDMELASSFGAQTFPILKHGAGGAPVLRWMFETIKQNYTTSHLFGYVNSDILFTSKFIDTLEFIVSVKKMEKPFFIVGRRVNVENVQMNEIMSDEDIENVARNRGQLFGANAEDYFITNSAFPWDKIVDVVVGRVAYDNWILGHVICNMRIAAIDVTDTVLAVHQTTTSGGNFEGFKHEHTNYNNALFKHLGIHPNFDNGFTICAQEYTRSDICGIMQLTTRTSFWSKCSCTTTNAIKKS